MSIPTKNDILVPLYDFDTDEFLPSDVPSNVVLDTLMEMRLEAFGDGNVNRIRWIDNTINRVMNLNK
jgi:hypothetical protein